MAKYFVALLVLAAVYAAEGKTQPLQITIREHMCPYVSELWYYLRGTISVESESE